MESILLFKKNEKNPIYIRLLTSMVEKVKENKYDPYARMTCKIVKHFGFFFFFIYYLSRLVFSLFFEKKKGKKVI